MKVFVDGVAANDKAAAIIVARESELKNAQEKLISDQRDVDHVKDVESLRLKIQDDAKNYNNSKK